MERRILWSCLPLSLVLFALVALGLRPSEARASAGCFSPADDGAICLIVQHCDLQTCHYHLYGDTPPCRPAGSGPDCGSTD
jgi:hypothetical protein